MDNLGKCHGKINIMIGLEANGNSSNWLRTVTLRNIWCPYVRYQQTETWKVTKANAVTAIRTHPMPVSTTPQQQNLLQLPGKLATKSEAVRKERGKTYYKLFSSHTEEKARSTLGSKMWPPSRLKIKCNFSFL